MASAEHIAASDAFDTLHERLVAAGYEGWEFDDFLASPLVSALTGRSLMRQRIAIQVGERMPFNLRPLLAVPRLASSKARAFCARGYAWRYEATGKKEWLARAVESVDWLYANPSPGYRGLGWGNSFDFASRVGFIPRHHPTVVWTAHAYDAFSLVAKLVGDGRYVTALDRIGLFIAEELGWSEDSTGICFNYSPHGPAPIHNSNLLAARVLAAESHRTGNHVHRELSERAFAWSLERQQPDGGWPYGEGPSWSWIDNFHTAYVIDCLRAGHQYLGDCVPKSTIDRSVRYWLSTFFLADGSPRYYSDRTWPFDIQAAAQAIETLATLAPDHDVAASLAPRVLRWTLLNMRKPNGGFRYRRGRWFVNELESIHWGQATMLAALAAFVRFVCVRKCACGSLS